MSALRRDPVCRFYTSTSHPLPRPRRFRFSLPLPITSPHVSHSTPSLSTRLHPRSFSTSSFLRGLPSFSTPSFRPYYLLLLPLFLLLLLELPWDTRFSRHATARRRVQPGISIVACCMNRHATLSTVLSHWRAVPNVSEILIVDWSSAPPLRGGIADAFAADPRLKMLRVDGEAQWILSRAYNLAVSAAMYDTIIRTDCDYALAKTFTAAHVLEGPPAFYAGDYHHARNENELHLNGAMVIKREHFLAVGGYDERIQTYGWDDEDLYTRLIHYGLIKRNISYDHITHVPHQDKDRAQKHVTFVQVEIDLNALLLKSLPKWNQSALHVDQWAATTVERQYLRLHAVSKPPALKHIVSAEQLDQAWNMALSQRLANDYHVPWDIMQTMSVQNKRRLLTRLNVRRSQRPSAHPPRVLFVHVMHGLGNRLRALGSAMAFANSTDRELVVIWQMDAHNEAHFGDLFDHDMIILEEFKPKWPFDGYDRYDKSWLSFDLFNYMEMEGNGAVKGQRIEDKPDKHLYFKSAYIMEADTALTNWDKDNEMLRRLKPVKQVQDLIDVHLKNGLQSWVGVHIRDRTLDRDIKNVNFDAEYGDEASKEMEYWRKKSSYKNFMQQMTRMIGNDSTAQFYVATDTVAVLSKLNQQFGSKIHFTQRQCDGRDGKCVRFALVDILCLSKTKQLLGSNWSSFTEVASRFGGQTPKLAGRDF